MYTHAAAVGALAQRECIPYLLDATQSIGQMPIDVQQLQCDYLTSTGRKFLRAPRGTGLLYASRYFFVHSFTHPFRYVSSPKVTYVESLMAPYLVS